MYSNNGSLTAPDGITSVEAGSLDVGVPVVGQPVGVDGEGMVANLGGLARGHRPALSSLWPGLLR